MEVGQFMYAVNKNKTALQSRHMIADALIQLMKRKDFNLITVTEICEEAAISRKTFYRNFELREDVLEFWVDQIVEEYESEIDGLTVDERLRYHFRFVQKHQGIFVALYKNNMLWIAEKKFIVLLPKTMPTWSENSLEQEYRSEYIIAGIEAIQRVWISKGCRESIDEIVDIIHRAQDKQIPINE